MTLLHWRPGFLRPDLEAIDVANTGANALSQLNCGVLLPVVVVGWVGGGFAEPTTSAGRWVPQSLHPPYKTSGLHQVTANFTFDKPLGITQR